jgi:phage terminase small subunit
VRALALTKKEKAFCEEYVANGGNASRAYFAAYDTHSIEAARKAYCKVFRKPEVKEYIRELQKVAFDNACITAERVALKLADIAFADKEDEHYGATAQLKALDLIQKQLGLQQQKIEADLHTDIIINIEE